MFAGPLWASKQESETTPRFAGVVFFGYMHLCPVNCSCEGLGTFAAYYLCARFDWIILGG
jgi:hypothetical protein